MYEVIPAVAGVAAGLIAMRWFSGRARIAVLIALSIVFGFTASLITGELALSASFVAVDASQVLLGALVGSVAYAWWRRSSTQLR